MPIKKPSKLKNIVAVGLTASAIALGAHHIHSSTPQKNVSNNARVVAVSAENAHVSKEPSYTSKNSSSKNSPKAQQSQPFQKSKAVGIIENKSKSADVNYGSKGVGRNLRLNESINIYEKKNKSPFYVAGKKVNEENIIILLKKTPRTQDKMDLLNGFCFRYFKVNAKGEYFDIPQMKKEIKNERLQKMLELFMTKYKDKRLYRGEYIKTKFEY